MKAAIYTRVSTVYQIDKDSLPMQKKDLQEYCRLVLNINDFEIFEDAGYSAKNTDRPAFQQMMERLRRHEFTHVVVWKLDRISRNLADFANMWNEFDKLGIKFVSKNDNFQTDSPMGRAMLNIIMVFAQLERETTSMRVTATMISRAEDGRWNGANVPIGYKFNYETKYPEIDEEEAKTVHFIFDKYEEIRSSIKLAKYLNDNGYKTKRGGLWGGKVVGDILRNPFYKGTLRYNYRKAARGKIKPEDQWVVIENNHQGIISLEQWERVNKILKGNATRPFRQIIQTHTHIFSGLLQCSKCGGGFSSYLDKERSDGFRPSMYYCSNKGQGRVCDMNGYISDMVLGEFVLNYMSNMLAVQREYSSNKDNLESRLLVGKAFKNVAYIAPQSLTDLKLMLDDRTYKPNAIKNEQVKENTESAELLVKRDRFKRAIERLENLFLFDDNAMDEKEYLYKKTKLVNELHDIENKIASIAPLNDKKHGLFVDNNKTIDKCVLDWKLGSGDYINYKRLATGLDPKVLKDFMNMLIERIVIGEDRKILSIKFKSGLLQEFLYR